MNLFIVNMIAFYIIYWLITLKKETQAVLIMYQIEKDISDNNLIEMIKEDENILLMRKISKSREEGFDGFQKILNEINEYVEKEKRLNSDSEYREKVISDYRKDMHSRYALEGLKIACVTFLSNLWIMTPGIVLFALGGGYLPLLVLLLTMTKYAMNREEELSDAVAYLQGEEYLQKWSIRASIFLTATYDATVTQWYFITYSILLFFIN